MKIKTVVNGPFKENCYLLCSEESAVIIDPGKCNLEIEKFCEENKQKEKAILLTHCHFDHILGAKKIRDKYGYKVYISHEDNQGLINDELSLSRRFRFDQECFSADKLLSDGETVKIGDLTFNVIATPGHTKGSLCFLLGNLLFSGDTLFYETFGRVDLPSGNKDELVESIDKLLTLDGSIKVYSGHGQATTIAHEKEHNPYKRYF